MMNTDDDSSLQAPQVFVLQIVCGALIAGMVFIVGLFLIVVNAPDINLNLGPPPFGQPLLSLLAVVIAVVFSALIAIWRTVITTKVARIAAEKSIGQTDVPRLAALYSTMKIATFALCESAGLVAAIAYLIEREPAVLAVSALAAAYMLAAFPTRSRWRNWLEQQMSRLAELRQQF
jgi:hypothetical protein